MKVLILAFFVALASAKGYHRAIGIPAAERIRQAEKTRGLNARIVNGNYAQLGLHPYYGGLIIRLDINLISVCGSTLISNTKLVTAAHCWNDSEEQPIEMQVVLGSTTLFSGGMRITTNEVAVHEAFDINSIRNDIAIITVPAVTFDGNISPIKLPKNLRDKFVGVSAHVVGFGMTNDTAAVVVSQRLSYAEVTVLSDQHCLMYGSIFTTSMVCAEGKFSSPCMGDSGGPLLYKDGSEDILIGVVSYGSDVGCGVGHPSVYTRITSYVVWIQSNI